MKHHLRTPSLRFLFSLGVSVFLSGLIASPALADPCQDALNSLSETGGTGFCSLNPNGPAPTYFLADDFLKKANVAAKCEDSNAKCWFEPADKTTSYFCNQLGKLNGVTDAACQSGSGCPGGQAALEPDAKKDPCIDSGGPRTCCTASKITPTGAAATSVKATSEKGITRTSFGLKNPLGRRTVPQIIGSIVSWLGTFAGGLFMLYLVWGGLQWMAAGGSQEQVEAGRKKIIAAVAGIVIILLSYLIVDAVISFTTIR